MADIDKNSNENDLSSAELTANYRCAFPALSGDKLSQYLSNEAGRALAESFVTKYNYPLAKRKISVCSGYFLQETHRLLAKNRYDSVISFASGFSLLVYLIAQQHPGITLFDTDLPYMIAERNKRIKAAVDAKYLDKATVERLNLISVDIEHAYKDQKTLKDIFPHCKRPIFLLEGVSYFLSPDCLSWLFKQMAGYDQSAAILYYWPDDMVEKSTLFARVQDDMNSSHMVKEPFKSFWTKQTLNDFQAQFSKVKDLSIEEIEAAMVSDESERQLLDANQFFPIRLITGEQSG